MSRESHRTVARELRHEGAKIKGSRFIVTVAPIRAEAEAAGLVARLRGEFPAANHHCCAYRLGPRGDVWRASDDGEPSGSAGRPILRQIEGHALTDTVVVVSRIFGGTKLGVGGLIRAYGGAAAEALDLAEVVEIVAMRGFTLAFAYELSAPVQRLLAAEGLTPSESTYGESVVLRVELPAERAEAFLEQLRERTAGRVTVDPLDEPERGSS